MWLTIEPSMDLGILADQMYPRGAPRFDGTYADSEFWGHIVDFRDRLVEEAERAGWQDTGDVPDEAWNKLMREVGYV